MKFTKQISAAFITAIMCCTPVMAKETTALRLASATPDSHPSTQALKKVADQLNARPELNLKAAVFSGGSLGGDIEVLDQVSRGAVQVTAAGGISVLQGYDPKFGIEELPFLFSSHQAAYDAMDGELGDVIAELAEQYGFKILAYWENGFRHFTNNKRPILVPSDMQNLRFRSAESKIRLEMFRQLNASAVPMPFPELYQALQQGVIDGQENPAAVIVAGGFHSVQKNLALSRHIWNAIPIIVSKEWFDSLDKEQQVAIQEAFMSARTEQRAAIESSEAGLIEDLRTKGMEVSNVDFDAFRQATGNVWTYAEPIFGDELMSIAKNILDGESK